MRPDGTLLHCEWFNSALTDANGQVTSIMSLVEDVSARVTAEAQLRRLANATSSPACITGRRWKRCRGRTGPGERNGATVTLIFVDLDGFVNQRCARSCGNLTACCRKWPRASRAAYARGRYGGPAGR